MEENGNHYFLMACSKYYNHFSRLKNKNIVLI